MIITPQSMSTLFKGYNGSFSLGFAGAETHYRKVAMVVPSSTRENLYAWLGQFPKVREWIGERFIQNLRAHAYTVVNRSFENTVGVPRNDIEDDQYGVYGPMMQEMGKSAAELPDELVFGLLKNGFSAPCYDGQYFFDPDHPVLRGDNDAYSHANFVDGPEPTWYLLDTGRAMRPFLYQERRPFEFVSLDKPDDTNVFFKDEYIYGCSGRSNAAYGLWQFAFASRQPLTATNYAAARRGMMELRGDAGRLLGVRPNILVVPPSLEEEGLKLLNSALVEGGDTNPWKGTAELLVTPWVS